MFKYLLPLFLVFSSAAYAKTQTSISIGGMVTDRGNATLTIDADVTSEKGKWQSIYEFDSSYQQSKNKTTLNMISSEAKKNYALDNRNYVIGDVRYDFNQFRPWQHTGVISTGWGYKIVRSKNFKISNELTTGIRITDDGKYLVGRNSLWIIYNTGPVTVTNKFLYEKSNIDYYRNQTIVSYKLTNKFAVGIQNMYTKDVLKNNVTSFTFGAKF